MWDSLKQAFEMKSIVNQLLLRKQFSNLKMPDGETFPESLLKFEMLIRNLEMAGADAPEHDKLAELF